MGEVRLSPCEEGPYFADESFAISHDGPGVLTMYNPGRGGEGVNYSHHHKFFSRLKSRLR